MVVITPLLTFIVVDWRTEIPWEQEVKVIHQELLSKDTSKVAEK